MVAAAGCSVHNFHWASTTCKVPCQALPRYFPLLRPLHLFLVPAWCNFSLSSFQTWSKKFSFAKYSHEGAIILDSYQPNSQESNASTRLPIYWLLLRTRRAQGNKFIFSSQHMSSCLQISTASHTVHCWCPFHHPSHIEFITSINTCDSLPGFSLVAKAG